MNVVVGAPATFSVFLHAHNCQVEHPLFMAFDTQM